MGIPIVEVTEEDFDRINAVNYKGVYTLNLLKARFGVGVAMSRFCPNNQPT